MRARVLEPQLARAARAFPALLLTGPRRSGKTTLLRRAFFQGLPRSQGHPDPSPQHGRRDVATAEGEPSLQDRRLCGVPRGQSPWLWWPGRRREGLGPGRSGRRAAGVAGLVACGQWLRTGLGRAFSHRPKVQTPSGQSQRPAPAGVFTLARLARARQVATPVRRLPSMSTAIQAGRCTARPTARGAWLFGIRE